MYKKNAHNWIKHFDFMMLDIICLNISFVLALLIRMHRINAYSEGHYVKLVFVFTFVDVLMMLLFEPFKNVLKRGMFRELSISVKHTCLVFAGMTVYLFATQSGGDYSRIAISLTAVIYFVLGYALRLVWKKVLLKNQIVVGERSLIIITTDNMKNTVVNNIKNHNYEKYKLSGIVIIDNDQEGQQIDGVDVVANISNVTEYICREWVDEVLINIPAEDTYPSKLAEQLLEMGVVVHRKLYNEFEEGDYHQTIEKVGPYAVLTRSINVMNIRQRVAKRTLDIIGGIVGCLMTLILFIFLAPAIYIQSPGPIFFSQIRVGKNGKKFKIYKFRSMYMDAEERKKEIMDENTIKDGMMFKIPFDPRIIGCKKLPDGTIKKGVGNFIRDFSLDEFPQFFNILKGDMSLVGTRPPTVDEWEKYELHHRARLAIRPGLTGMWQVSGRSSITDFEKVVELDKKYITEWTFGLDIKILFKTVLVVLGKDGAM